MDITIESLASRLGVSPRPGQSLYGAVAEYLRGSKKTNVIAGIRAMQTSAVSAN